MHDDGLSYSNMKLKPKSKQLKQRHANVDTVVVIDSCIKEKTPRPLPGRRDDNARLGLIRGSTETENDLRRKTVKSHPSLLSAGK